MPLLWLILPLLYVWPIPEIGKSIYRRVADSRTCSLPQAEISDQISKLNYQPRTNLRTIMVVGMSLFVINFLFGCTGRDGWPFSCYPRFASMAGPQVEILQVVPLSSTDTPIPFEQKDLKEKFSPQRFTGLNRAILKKTDDPIEKQQKLSALWQAISRTFPRFQQAKSVQFYQTTLWTEPTKQLENPVKRSLIFELPVN